MIDRQSLPLAVYIGVGAVIMSLTGIFDAFSQRFVVANWLNLNTVLVIITLVGAGYFVARRLKAPPLLAGLLNGLLSGLIVAGMLALLVLVETSIDLRFIFPNLSNPVGGSLTFGQDIAPGLATLLAVGAALGALGGGLALLPARFSGLIVSSLGLTVIIGLLENQIKTILTLPDALALLLAFAAAYSAARLLRPASIRARLGVGLAAGAIVGIVLALPSGTGLLRGAGGVPIILSLPPLLFPLIFALIGGLGGLVTTAGVTAHNGAIYFIATALILGILNAQGRMTNTAALLTLALLATAGFLTPVLSAGVVPRFEALPIGERRTTNRLVGLAALLVLAVFPLFAGQYITNVLNLVGLYIVMGIGLNIVVGYAGLLDLGYVAFFAIGAYAMGLLTTPSLLTCGGADPATLTPETVAQTCTGVLDFWQAWPLAVLVSGLAGVTLGIPVLRLRGDYLAIVTLGFGEIIRIVVKSDDFKPLFGAAQGIANIPRPTIDLTFLNPAWRLVFDAEAAIYYLVLAIIIVTALIALRLSGARLGRAWRAMRADEDVAQAMGVNLTRTKLLAFAIGASFAGMGGAIAATRLYGVYPDSFTLLVSINVLSLIIIGGLGSIPGVIVGSLMLIGLPEVLRELEDYRLLAFGVLLIVVMLSKPQGLIPPPVRRLSEVAAERRAREGASAS